MGDTNGRAPIAGVGKGEPILETGVGYRTSHTPYRNDLLQHRAILHISAITSIGATDHGEENWRKGSVTEHLNKADIHLHAYFAGDDQDDHLGHAAWRIMAALEISLTSKPEEQEPGSCC